MANALTCNTQLLLFLLNWQLPFTSDKWDVVTEFIYYKTIAPCLMMCIWSISIVSHVQSTCIACLKKLRKLPMSSLWLEASAWELEVAELMVPRSHARSRPHCLCDFVVVGVVREHPEKETSFSHEVSFYAAVSPDKHCQLLIKTSPRCLCSAALEELKK